MEKKKYISPTISVIEVAPATMIAASMHWTPTGDKENGFDIIEEDENHLYDDDSF